jgi:hypothetical protein
LASTRRGRCPTGRVTSLLGAIGAGAGVVVVVVLLAG